MLITANRPGLWFCRAGNCGEGGSEHLPVPPLQLPVPSSHPEAPDPTAPAPECREGAVMQVPSSVGGHRGASVPLLPAPAPHSQLVGAVAGLVHPVTFLQQLEELLDRHAGVGRAAQREDLPQQHAEGPPARGRQRAEAGTPAPRSRHPPSELWVQPEAGLLRGTSAEALIRSARQTPSAKSNSESKCSVC